MSTLLYMFYVYVLKSKFTDRLYKGFCMDLERRLSEHNSGKTKSTKPFVPWNLVYVESYSSQEEAIAREKYFKTSAGRRFLKKKI